MPSGLERDTSSQFGRCQDLGSVLLQKNILHAKVPSRRKYWNSPDSCLGHCFFLCKWNGPEVKVVRLTSSQLVIFEGNPVSASWTGVGTFIFDTVKFGLAQVGTSIALDFVVLAYPLPILFGLHMQRRRKVAVGLIFWLGALYVVLHYHTRISH